MNLVMMAEMVTPYVTYSIPSPLILDLFHCNFKKSRISLFPQVYGNQKMFPSLHWWLFSYATDERKMEVS
jgi:hypothetical protein